MRVVDVKVPTQQNTQVPHTSIRRVEADGRSVFYREAAQPDQPVVFLLHGFPTSSFSRPLSTFSTSRVRALCLRYSASTPVNREAVRKELRPEDLRVAIHRRRA